MEPRRLTYVRNLPWYAQVEQVPTSWKWFGASIVAPLWFGAFYVHYDANRFALGSSLHYASVVVAAQGGMHWGMEAIGFGLPTHTSEFTPLYRFVRSGLPVVPLIVGIMASRLSIENPRAASVLLLCVLAGSTGMNFFAYAFATCPVWFTRFQWQLSAGLGMGILMLMLSDQMKLRGELELVDSNS